MSRLLVSAGDSQCPRLFHRCIASTSACRSVESQQAVPTNRPLLGPGNASTPRLERKLMREKSLTPIGNRRKRALAREGPGIPFEHQPYQCFQEARQYLMADRRQKMIEIQQQRERIQRLRAKQVATSQDDLQKERRIISMQQRLEKLKLQADMNDPTVKRIFEDGKGDINKPIYRFLAERQWKSYKKKILDQRIEQMRVVPDVLPKIDISMDMDLYFGGKRIDPGAFVDSKTSQSPPRLRLQPYNKGERLVSIAVVTPDVPDVANDSFSSRLHYLICNVKLSLTETSVNPRLLSKDSQIAHDWLPPYSQKGAPYQRLAIIVMEQTDTIDAISARALSRDGFSMRSFVDKQRLRVVSAGLFRSQWDDNTADTMKKFGVPGHDIQFKRMKIEPLPYKRLDTARYR